jgi:DNA-binding SARP family transcriptional activator/TolB-like protein/Flp pilus assembly protein TadD
MSIKIDTSSSFEVHLLGPFHVVVNGLRVADHHWSRHKPKLLVKLLALQPHHQLHREQLMEMLWPSLDPEAAVNNLHKTIHMARHALEPELKSAADSHFILTRSQQVQLHGPGGLWTDVEAFEQHATEALKSGNPAAYEATLALYKGDLLIEDLYEEWATVRREQLRMTRRHLLTKLAQLYEARGDFEQSIERLNEVVVLDPAEEEAHRQLMRLYALTGSKRQSLRQFQICCEALRKELGARPERETMELHGQIISGHIHPILPGGVQQEHDYGQVIASLAVLPFANSSANPNAEYLSDGITESIINGLSQLRRLRVMARSTVFSYKGREADPRVIGRDLGVSAVVIGRVLQFEDMLIIRAELIDVADGTQLWGEQYDRKISDILAVQEEISREISEKLRLKLTSDEQKRLTKRYTENTEAYRLYLKGRYFWNKRTEEGVKKGIQFFRQAIAKDPNYALAYAGLADSYIILGNFGVAALPLGEAVLRAREAAVTALELDDTLAEAHALLGCILVEYDWNWPDAEKEFKRAIELNPNYATAHHWYAFIYLVAIGRLDEAIGEEKRAQELDPLSLIINTNVGTLLYLARQYDEAIEQYQNALEIDPTFIITHWMLGLAYEQKEMYREAIMEFQRAVALSGESALPLALLGHAYAISGEESEALKVLNELEELSKRKYVSPYRVGAIHVGLGDGDQAIEWLQRAYQERDAWLIWLKADPVFDSLRSDPRFQDILRRIGLAS